MTDEAPAHPFLTIAQAADEINVNQKQVRALLRTGELRGIQAAAIILGIHAALSVFR